jgi:hypothetical protein
MARQISMVFFKARSSARDKTSDQARVAALVRQINEVRTGVMKERRGLERRYADFVGQASQLVDTGYEGERDEAPNSNSPKWKAMRSMPASGWPSLTGIWSRLKLLPSVSK